MPITLAQAQALSQDKLTTYVMDEFRKSPLMDALVWDNTVKPQGGRSLTYVYNRVTTLPTAATRALNAEYTAQEAVTTQQAVNLKVFGGRFQIDRVLAADEQQVIDLVQFQLAQKTQAARALFTDMFINGDSGSDATEFDGLDAAIAGSSTEAVPATAIDLSSAAAVESNWPAFLYELRQLRKKLDGAPTLMLVNADLFAVIQTIADRATQFQVTKTDLGAEVVQWGNALIMDVGDKPGTSTPIIGTSTETETQGETSLYVARVGLDGVHGVSPDGTAMVQTYLPNMAEPGAVKSGEVEMVAAVALKSSRAAGALRRIKVA